MFIQSQDGFETFSVAPLFIWVSVDTPPPDSPEEQTELAMPSYPPPRSGYLVGVSEGPYDLDGVWGAEAQTCETPRMLQVISWEHGMGTLMVFDIREQADPVAEYSVVIGDDRLTARPPPFVRFGVQQLARARAVAFQGWDGTVEITSYDERVVSGRFAVSLREVQSGDVGLYAGTFERIPIAAPSDSGCVILGPMGSAMEPADSTAPDTTR